MSWAAPRGENCKQSPGLVDVHAAHLVGDQARLARCDPYVARAGADDDRGQIGLGSRFFSRLALAGAFSTVCPVTFLAAFFAGFFNRAVSASFLVAFFFRSSPSLVTLAGTGVGAEGAGWSELAQLVADHRLRDEDRNVFCVRRGRRSCGRPSSGKTVEVRDQVLSICLLPDSFIAEIRFIRLSSTHGPFFVERPISAALLLAAASAADDVAGRTACPSCGSGSRASACPTG